MKPAKNTIQWLAPHLSDGEVVLATQSTFSLHVQSKGFKPLSAVRSKRINSSQAVS